ncbi:hypothetical protein [Neglectibacter caecimuris]|uniref:hypothetical protein n=1 Tax=Neglectibacter caecimuris TaxID=3093658 RepID=UPI002AC896A2|nr:hypothetical protein [Neglectibacter sp. M00184]
MVVFDVFASNFFSVLVLTNREIYVKSLLFLHQMFQFELDSMVALFLPLSSRRKIKILHPKKMMKLSKEV